MGFFSSKKVEPSVPASQRGPARIIFSRFYGKSKFTGRSSPPPLDSPYPPASVTTLPLSVRTPEPDQSLSFSGRPVSADALTMSLAQRLNELAIANADGLLNDDEYRLLRQNLFERYGVGEDLAAEAHVVSKLNGTNNRRPAPSLKRTPSVSSNRSISTAVSSLFRRSTNRSVLSPSASISGSIFSAQQQMSPTADSVSVISSPSRRPSISSRSPYSTIVSHGLSRRPSDESLISSAHANATPASLTNDMRGIIYRHNIIGNASYASSTSSRVTTRSSKPPSSFNLRHPGLRQAYSRTHEEDEDDDHPKSTAELREEIETLESEWRKLHDAFNGLELSALTKSRNSATGVPLNAISEVPQHRVSIYPETASPSALGSAYTLIPNRAGTLHVNAARNHVPPVKQPVTLKRRPSVVNSIASSLKSSTTDLRNNLLLAPAAPSLHSTRSSPNLNASMPAAPAPALPASHSVPGGYHYNHSNAVPRPAVVLNGSSSPIIITPAAAAATRPSPPSLHRMNGLVDPALHEVETELADIRRRKADVSMRYERRLEFLRAKLKAAEIRERLIKK